MRKIESKGRKIFEQLAPSKFHWPEKYKRGDLPPLPRNRKLKIEQYEPH
jgi:hypothetical protein